MVTGGCCAYGKIVRTAMPLSAGTRLGPYEVVAPIGAGGMGEVYRAKDTRLDRTVAVKILPSHLSDNPEARQRFDREARAISSLNHPNICTLHDVGHQDGVDFLVMEFLEGETLADRLAKGPLPTEQVLKYGIEICEGLDRAHKSGVVHRDLKPGNVMLTKTGAKLMDFGLAKATTPGGPVPASSLTMTIAEQPLTARGTIVGTFQYMSPEQTEGKEADARSDIFALGAMLYEMITGKRAFTGKSQASMVAAILASEPTPISVAQPMTPPALAQLVKTCLAKDPEERFQTVHDLKLQLKWIAEASSSQLAAPAQVRARRVLQKRTLLIAAVAGWILAAAALAIIFLTSRSQLAEARILAATQRYRIRPRLRRCAGTFAGWFETRVPDRWPWRSKVVDPRRNHWDGAPGRRSQAADISLLVARWQVHRFLFGGEVEEGSAGRRTCASTLRCTRRPRRVMERAWGDHLHPKLCRPPLQGARGRRLAREDHGPEARLDPSQSILSTRRRSLPVHCSRPKREHRCALRRLALRRETAPDTGARVERAIF
jgi:predicted Ser/Thr protein kinase